MLGLAEGESHMNFTCGGGGCVPHVAALTCRLCEPCMDVFSFFSQNKDSDGDKERGDPAETLNTAECGSCGKHRKINYGRGGGEEAWVLYSAGLRRLSGPFLCGSNAVQGGAGAGGRKMPREHQSLLQPCCSRTV